MSVILRTKSSQKVISLVALLIVPGVVPAEPTDVPIGLLCLSGELFELSIDEFIHDVPESLKSL